jgi:hypothetical protein
MAITKISARQEVISARAEFGYGDLTSGTAVAAIDLPPNARIERVLLRVTEAFNSGTSDALTVQSNEGTPKTYLVITAASASLPLSKVWSAAAAVAGTTSSNFGFVNPVASTVDILWASVGTACSTGKATLIVEYVVDGRAEFSQG